METKSRKVINAIDMPNFVLDNITKTVTITVMSGALKDRVVELRKLAKGPDGKVDPENKNAIKADELEKKHTFKLQIHFVRVSLMDIVSQVVRPQSLVVSLQNSLFRPLGDDKIEWIASGAHIKKKPDHPVWTKDGVAHVDLHKWLNRPKRTAMSDEEKARRFAEKASLEQLKAMQAVIEGILASKSDESESDK